MFDLGSVPLRSISSIKVLRLRDIDLSEVVLLPLKLKLGPGHSITALAWASRSVGEVIE
jgi:hypothetical protein